MTDFPKRQELVKPLYKTSINTAEEKNDEANIENEIALTRKSIIRHNSKDKKTTRQHSIKNLVEINRNNRRRKRGSGTNSVLPFDGVIIPKLQDTTQQILIRSGYKWCSYLQPRMMEDGFEEINFRDDGSKTNYQNNLEININGGDINNVTELLQQNSKNLDYIDDTLGFQPQVTNFQIKGNNSTTNNQQKQHPSINTIVSSASLTTNNNNANAANINSSPLKPPRHIKPKKTRNLSCPVNLNNTIRNNAEFSAAVINKDIYLDNSSNNIRNEVLINEFKKAYRSKTVSIGVQASPLPPYRLRVLPKCPQVPIDDKSTSAGDEEKVVNPTCCLCFGARRCGQCIGRVIMSQCGLGLALFAWALLGAAAFYYTEGPFELEQSQKLKALQNDLVIGLATDLRHVNNYEPVWLDTIKKYISKHETFLLEGVSSGYGEGGGTGGQIWSYPGCILFAISLLTTLGFGAPVPRTTLGRSTAVVFSAIGIPLHFLLVLNIGMVLARCLQRWAMTCSTTCALDLTEKRHIDLHATLPKWINWFPFIAGIVYYIIGILIFGVSRQRKFESFLFPLDFTATGGVALTPGYMRIIYGLYLEGAVILGGTAVSLLQNSATGKLTDIGLKLGLLTNS